MVGYCLSASRCRRKLIAEHFEERWSPADCARHCDTCQRPAPAEKRDVTRYARALQGILSKAAAADTRLTAAKVIDAWLGSGPAHLRVPGHEVPTITRPRAEAVLAHLLTESYIKEDFHFTPYKTISYLVPGPNEGNYPVHMEVAGAPATAAASAGAGSAGNSRSGSASSRAAATAAVDKSPVKRPSAASDTRKDGATDKTRRKSKLSVSAVTGSVKDRVADAGPGKRSGSPSTDGAAAKRRKTLLDALEARGVRTAKGGLGGDGGKETGRGSSGKGKKCETGATAAGKDRPVANGSVTQPDVIVLDE